MENGLLWRLGAAAWDSTEIAEDLLEKADGMAAGRGFTADNIHVARVGQAETLDAFHRPAFVEVDRDNLLLFDPRIHEGPFFFVRANVIPDPLIERTLARWRAQQSGNAALVGLANLDSLDLGLGQEIAADRGARAASGQKDGAEDDWNRNPA